ncbi:hypothetical protein J3A83DRAFT_4370416 [Scleroderma citrinum]
MINGRIIGAELREVPPERLPVWGQRWTNPRLALGPSEWYEHEFHIGMDPEGAPMLMLNVPNEPSIMQDTDHGDSVSSSSPPSPSFTLPSNFNSSFGSLYRDIPTSSDTSSHADHTVPPVYAQRPLAQQSSLLEAGIFPIQLIEEMPESPSYSDFPFDDLTRDGGQITQSDVFGASLACGLSSAGVTRHPLAFSSDCWFSADDEISFQYFAPTPVLEEQPMYWLSHNTSPPLGHTSAHPSSLTLQHDDEIFTNVSSSSGYMLPHPAVEPDISWHNRANQAIFGQALWRHPDLPVLLTNKASEWTPRHGSIQPPHTAAVTQPSESIYPAIFDVDRTRLCLLGGGLYSFPVFGVEGTLGSNQLCTGSAVSAPS